MGSSSKNKTQQSSTKQTILGNTTTSNPYLVSATNDDGTISSFVEGSAFDTINDFVNDNFQNILNNYLNPSLDDTTNQSKLKAFTDNINNQATLNLENNIINPLSNRNMIRSSQATDMYKNLQNSIDQSIYDYTVELLGSSQENSANILNNLMSLYLNGFNAVLANQAQSLSTSSANATQNSNSTTTSTQRSGNYLNDTLDLAEKLGSAYLTGGASLLKNDKNK